MAPPNVPNLMCKIALAPGAKIPTYGSAKAAGMDLYSNGELVVPAKGQALVSTGIRMEFPRGYYGWVAPRSGLAVKNGIHVGAGVIDEDYIGEIKVCLFNHSDSDFKVKAGDRIAQMVLQHYAHASFQEVKEEELSPTERGDGGFGSTGVSQ
ncbi:unnamed protein product [Bursaphelenchus okinawaensis]|uniref:Deoxyuridine 5'-triphosphate nucleotidohydrolase n=1 Tax=Bursaphelenchus okinawaensis TaxID=465554 RepID=A0A811KSH2_9BILA|nr:unnamed protein product [Bursaphelenchus okinawaensis]CAG9111529.1 unnamed protein product [Bursaphelenchus okinawaensis]